MPLFCWGFSRGVGGGGGADFPHISKGVLDGVWGVDFPLVYKGILPLEFPLILLGILFITTLEHLFVLDIFPSLHGARLGYCTEHEPALSRPLLCPRISGECDGRCAILDRGKSLCGSTGRASARSGPMPLAMLEMNATVALPLLDKRWARIVGRHIIIVRLILRGLIVGG